jgi:hypothetical protein
MRVAEELQVSRCYSCFNDAPFAKAENTYLHLQPSGAR